jgi:uncharacterized DUF497 family protein
VARLARRMAGYRVVRWETFKGIRWKRQNRLWHEKHTRTDPWFSAACKLDWSRVLKRPDKRHSDGRQLGILARDLGAARVVYFVVYVKRNGFLNVISIRYAETDEEHAFFRHFP